MLRSLLMASAKRIKLSHKHACIPKEELRATNHHASADLTRHVKKLVVETSHVSDPKLVLSPAYMDLVKKCSNNHNQDVDTYPGLVVHCDGACSPKEVYMGMGVAAFHITDGNARLLCLGKKEDRITNNRAELYAIINALEYVLNTPVCNAWIQTDSQYSYNCLVSYMDGWNAERVRNPEYFKSFIEPNLKNTDLIYRAFHLLGEATLRARLTGHHVILFNVPREFLPVADILAKLGRSTPTRILEDSSESVVRDLEC